MSTTRFVLFGLVLFSTRVSSESYLTKCCPPGEIFSESQNSTTECVSVPRNAMELYVHHHNTTAMLYQGIPQCDESEDLMKTTLDKLDLNNFVEVPACLEILYNQVNGRSTVIVVHCRSHKNRQKKAINASLPLLTYIRKCCPRNTVFDSRMKSCVSRLDETESLEAFLLKRSPDAHLVVAAEGPPTCKGPIVNYEIDKNDIFLWNRTYLIIVPANNNIKEEISVTEDNACLEMTSDSMSSRTLIARVCRDREYCVRNAWTRKCAENEYFYIDYLNSPCNKLGVLNKLTKFHEAFANAVKQTKSSAFDMTKDYGVLTGKPCKYGMHPMNPQKDIWVLTSKGGVSLEPDVDNQNEHCELQELEFNQSFYLYMCTCSVYPKVFVERSQLYPALHIISCAFLLMTLLVYLCLPSLQNLHGKTLMCHVSSLLLAFICLPIITWFTPGEATEERPTAMCKGLAYTTLFSSLSTFSWLNVMCFDIWWTFGVSRGSTSTNVREQRKRFLLYCLYAWGLSFLVSILAIIADSTDILPDYLQPEIDSYCWFAQEWNSYGEVTFFIGPVMILLISNVVFFILTSIHYNKVKAEIRRVTMNPMDPRNKRFHSDRKRLIMNVKLFIVMGMSWIWEVVPLFLTKYLPMEDPPYVIFYIIDIFIHINCLGGVLIFILFVLKSRVYQALRKRLGIGHQEEKIQPDVQRDHDFARS